MLDKSKKYTIQVDRDSTEIYRGCSILAETDWFLVFKDLSKDEEVVNKSEVTVIEEIPKSTQVRDNIMKAWRRRCSALSYDNTDSQARLGEVIDFLYDSGYLNTELILWEKL